LVTKRGEPWFCIAGIWRTDKDVGEAFTILTMPPGPDIQPYHDRQIAVLDRADLAAWLDPSVSAKTILKPLPRRRHLAAHRRAPRLLHSTECANYFKNAGYAST
jgi:putative SOS response-associated peptidase YedK